MPIPIHTYLAELFGIEESRIESDESHIDEIFRRRLTKKERKLLHLSLEQSSKEAIMEKLDLDEERFEEISESLRRKIRHPKLRNELVDA